MWTLQQKVWGAQSNGGNLGLQQSSAKVVGDTLVIGAENAASIDIGVTIAGFAAVGAAYLWTRAAGVWTQQQRIVSPGQNEDDRFGASVALSSSGTSIGVSVHFGDGNVVNGGFAFVFTA